MTWIRRWNTLLAASDASGYTETRDEQHAHFEHTRRFLNAPPNGRAFKCRSAPTCSRREEREYRRLGASPVSKTTTSTEQTAVIAPVPELPQMPRSGIECRGCIAGFEEQTA